MSNDFIDQVDRDLWQLHERFIVRSGNHVGSIGDERFLALALAGEVGEVANFVKKEWRGDRVDREKLKDELSDVFAYWCLLVRCAGFDVTGVMVRSHSKAVERLKELEAEVDSFKGWPSAELKEAASSLLLNLFNSDTTVGKVGMGQAELHVYVLSDSWNGDRPLIWKGYQVVWHLGGGPAAVGDAR